MRMFFLGMMAAYTPAMLFLAYELWRADERLQITRSVERAGSNKASR